MTGKPMGLFSFLKPPPSASDNEEDSENGKILLRILDDLNFRYTFTKFLKSEYAEENLLFWDAVDAYHNAVSVEDKFIEAKTIFRDFINDGAKYEINLPAKIRKELRRHWASHATITADLFDPAQKSIFHLLLTDSFPRFIKTKEWETLKAQLAEPPPTFS